MSGPYVTQPEAFRLALAHAIHAESLTRARSANELAAILADRNTCAGGAGSIEDRRYLFDVDRRRVRFYTDALGPDASTVHEFTWHELAGAVWQAAGPDARALAARIAADWSTYCRSITYRPGKGPTTNESDASAAAHRARYQADTELHALITGAAVAPPEVLALF